MLFSAKMLTPTSKSICFFFQSLTETLGCCSWPFFGYRRLDFWWFWWCCCFAWVFGQV